MKTSLRWTTLAACALLFGGGGPLAGDECGGRLREAGASDEQIARIRELHHERAAEAIDLEAALHRARLELHRVEADPAAAEAAIHAAIDAVFDARAAMARHHASTRLEARRILGEENWRKLHAQGHPHPEHGERFAGFHHHPGEGGGPHGGRDHGHLGGIHEHLRRLHEHLRDRFHGGGDRHGEEHGDRDHGSRERFHGHHGGDEEDR